jgi:acyl-CoA thioester hydrolase
MSQLLEGYPTVISLPVAWGEMDALNHVNNTVYFKYFESARLAYMESIEGWGILREQGMVSVLASTSARFKVPLTYPDTIDVGARVTEIAEDRFEMQYAVYSHRHQRIAAQGQALVVTIDRESGRKTPIPPALKNRIAGR